jgi:site-specific recombinase XerD
LTATVPPDSLRAWSDSFRRHLESENKAKPTVISYMGAIALFSGFLIARDGSDLLADVGRTDLQDFFIWMLERQRPHSVVNRFRGLRVFFNWLVSEEELEKSPMAGLKMPHVPDEPPPLIADAELRQLLKACDGRTFEDRRDTAVVRLLIDTGMRRSEMSSIQLADLNMEGNIVVVFGKGRRHRACPFGKKTAMALDRYLRVRRQHAHAAATALWLGERGGLTTWGIRDIVETRAKAAGLPHIHAHLFRHTFASSWLSNGGAEGDLMALAGWRSRIMIDRYGRVAKAARAIEAHRRNAPGDRI